MSGCLCTVGRCHKEEFITVNRVLFSSDRYYLFMLKNYRFKHTCNDDNDIRRRKQQKLVGHILTCKFPVSYMTMLADHDIEIGNLHVKI